MKKLLFFLFFFTFSNLCKADYTPIPLDELILISDKIVVGEIVEVEPVYITIRVEQSLNHDWGFLKIRRFINWTCAMRWTPYQNGQKLVFFLREEEGDYFPIGAGNEGEMPVLEGIVYINDQALSMIDYYYSQQIGRMVFNITPYFLYGGRYHGIKYSLLELMNTVRFVRNCYRIEPENGWAYKRELLCSEEEILAKSEGSDLRLSIFYDFKNRMD
ncbi:hypothetical protein [Algoriphagus zhangzhouensis]|uniref:Uncharacterized protein n=1 Tax=Algoriphagus zhangzhouensis TaxID=1073327 RepID=A0A1M7Z3Q2_9BACT|nr:hypothetical protein [Algoriphagus zhangzhouensis]TDY48473.1 hypothetical protein A8938_0157 [Algoriphagus zhangzhouensis]SHO59521.1 hypothetical protein SAMN04488108_0158 [Algoriphagus zhangzhouensis]